MAIATTRSLCEPHATPRFARHKHIRYVHKKKQMNGLFEVASPFCRRDEPAGPLKERPRREGTGAIALAILCHGMKSDEMVKMRSLLSRLGINVKNVSGCSRSNSLFYVGNHGDQPRGGEEDRCLNEAPFKGPIKVRARKALHGGMILLGPRGVSPQSEAQSLHSIWRSLMNRAAHINSSWVLGAPRGLAMRTEGARGDDRSLCEARVTPWEAFCGSSIKVEMGQPLGWALPKAQRDCPQTDQA